ncbi:hypothetical protein Syun_009259 [Stephania yunnanensis]|uniref:Uncharacterized protein n=1 Tax=Stephania yunnanensis TaxID=152371 RepID=A0AAP0KF86_9MAGN
MPQYQLLEILQTLLQELCLHIKSVQLGVVLSFLAKALQLSDPLSVQNAIKLLKTIRFVDDMEELTPLGMNIMMENMRNQFLDLLSDIGFVNKSKGPEMILMESPITMIKDIGKTNDTLKVKARVSRKWSSINLKNNDTLLPMDVILLDENSTLDAISTITLYLQYLSLFPEFWYALTKLSSRVSSLELGNRRWVHDSRRVEPALAWVFALQFWGYYRDCGLIWMGSLRKSVTGQAITQAIRDSHLESPCPRSY